MTRYLGCESNWISKIDLVEFMNLFFDGQGIGGKDGPLFLPNMGCIWPCVDVILNNGHDQI
jgi:hypothetical protein